MQNENYTLFKVLSFLIPIVGLVLFLVWKDSEPEKAKACGKWALIGFVVSFVLGIISSCATTMMVASLY